MKLYDKVFVPVDFDKWDGVNLLHDGAGNVNVEEQQNKYVLSEDELSKILSDFFFEWYNSKGTNTEEAAKDYVKNKLNK